jgi:hypothetical protein
MVVKRTYLSNDLEGVYEIEEALERLEEARAILTRYFEFDEYAEGINTMKFEINSDLEEFRDMLTAKEKAEAKAINREYLKSVSV